MNKDLVSYREKEIQDLDKKLTKKSPGVCFFVK